MVIIKNLAIAGVAAVAIAAGLQVMMPAQTTVVALADEQPSVAGFFSGRSAEQEAQDAAAEVDELAGPAPLTQVITSNQGMDTILIYGEHGLVTGMAMRGEDAQVVIDCAYEFDADGAPISLLFPFDEETADDGSPYSVALRVNIENVRADDGTITDVLITLPDEGESPDSMSFITTADALINCLKGFDGYADATIRFEAAGTLTRLQDGVTRETIGTYAGLKSTTSYDAEGRNLSTSIVQEETGEVLSQTDYTYDEGGRIASVSTPSGESIDFTYQQSAGTDGGAIYSAPVPDDGGELLYEYDAGGKLLRMVLGSQTTFYDEHGRVAKTQIDLPDGSMYSITNSYGHADDLDVSGFDRMDVVSVS